MIECDGFAATIGTLCEIIDDNNGSIAAEIIGFRNNNNLLFVHKTGARISVGAKVKVVDEGQQAQVYKGENVGITNQIKEDFAFITRGNVDVELERFEQLKADPFKNIREGFEGDKKAFNENLK